MGQLIKTQITTTPLPCTLDGISGTDNIVELWQQHYSTLFTCVQSTLFRVANPESNDSWVIMSHEVYQAINKLSDNKASALGHVS